MYIHPGGNLYLRHHHHHNGARQAVSVSGVSTFGSAAVPASTSTPATSLDPSQTELPTSSKSLIGICAVVGTCLLAIIIWQIRTIIQKSRKARAAKAARARFSYMYGIKEKPAFVSFADTVDDDSPRKSPVLIPTPADPYARWKPQIRGVTVPPIAVTHAERSPKVQDEFPPTPKSGPIVSPLPSPPPAYRILGLHTIPLPDSPPDGSEIDVPPPTPMHRSPRRTASTPPVRESFDLPPAPGPMPSPRSASFQHHIITDATPASTPRASLASLSGRKSALPRLMIVTTSFESTRHDELSLRTGETMRLIREFDDEWCLVQRVGRHTAERGVVPRLCLSERPRVVKDYVRFSNSILSTVRRK